MASQPVEPLNRVHYTSPPRLSAVSMEGKMRVGYEALSLAHPAGLWVRGTSTRSFGLAWPEVLLRVEEAAAVSPAMLDDLDAMVKRLRARESS